MLIPAEGEINRTTYMRKYRHPPIVERALSVGVNLNEEMFHRRFEDWKNVVTKAFPVEEVVTLWDLEVEEKDGMPSLSPNQKMSIRHRFWKDEGERGKVGVQVWSNRLVVNLIGTRSHPRVFSEVETLGREWLKRWAEHFDITEVKGIQLEYVNIISHETVPLFATANRIQLGKILKHFAKPLVPGRSLLSPYELTMNEEVSKDPPLTLLTKLSSIKEAVALRLDYKATTEHSARNVSLEAASAEIRVAHDCILSEFETSFTAEALESFGPYDTAAQE